MKTFVQAPYFKRKGEAPSVSSHYKHVKCSDVLKYHISSVLVSNVFYLWYVSKSNGRDFSKDDYLEYPIGFNELMQSKQTLESLKKLGKKYIEDMKRNKKRVIYQKKSGAVVYDQYWVEKSKEIADQIDTVLAQHYNFTEEELDFIINYDIKYRMGKELDAYIEGALGSEKGGN